MTHLYDDNTPHGVIARGICEWDPDEFADFEGDDIATVALDALAAAGYVIEKADGP